MLELGGLNVITDPIFSERCSPVSFAGPEVGAELPGVALEDLPRIDVVLLSHNHYDHCDKAFAAGSREAAHSPVVLTGSGKRSSPEDASVFREVVELALVAVRRAC